jgi:membrane associated rhomboid family serine protease
MLPVRDHLPTRSVPGVTYALIAINVLAYVFEALSLGSGATSAQWIPGALVPAELVAHPLREALTLLSHMFLHGGLAHLAGNMLFLWLFGDNVEDALGHGRYALFYLTAGTVAALAQVVSAPGSMVPMVGASGAISGVLAAYAVLYPRSPIKVVNPIPVMWLFWGFFIWLPAWVVILEWFAANLWSALHPTSSTGGVAFTAHVGGFVAGLLLQPLLRTQERVPHQHWDHLLPERRRFHRA